MTRSNTTQHPTTCTTWMHTFRHTRMSVSQFTCWQVGGVPHGQTCWLAAQESVARLSVDMPPPFGCIPRFTGTRPLHGATPMQLHSPGTLTISMFFGYGFAINCLAVLITVNHMKSPYLCSPSVGFWLVSSNINYVCPAGDVPTFWLVRQCSWHVRRAGKPGQDHPSMFNKRIQRVLQFSKENDPLSKYMTVRWFIDLAGTTWPSSIYTKSVSIADEARCYITQPGLLGTALTAAARQGVKEVMSLLWIVWGAN